jgi:hypothetical protein
LYTSRGVDAGCAEHRLCMRVSSAVLSHLLARAAEGILITDDIDIFWVYLWFYAVVGHAP